jgi:sigma-B regulation protein RsbU (phosphoserine phosphatase)
VKRRHVILLVDDQPIIGETLRSTLRDAEDIDLHLCLDPAQALSMAIALRPTLILQDLVMPEVDGLLLLRFYRAHPATRQIPLMILSSREEPATKEQAFQLGASDYIVKLPHPTELLARLRHHSTSYLAQQERDLAFAQLEEARAELADEVAQAGQYARRLLPPPMETDGLIVDYLYEPSLDLGGDMLGYQWLSPGILSFYLLDVVGHGVGASLHGVTVTTVLRSRLLGADLAQPAETLAALNRTFLAEQHGGRYFTLWYGVLDQHRRALTYASAAHPGALLLGPEGELSELGSGDTMIGLVPDALFHQRTVAIHPGSALHVFSDGAYEIEGSDGKLWPTASFEAALLQGGPLDDFLAACRRARGGPRLDDDCTVLRLRLR